MADRYAEMLAKIDPIAERAASLAKKIENDVVLGRLGDVVKDARKLASQIDKVRKEEVDPHLAAQRGTNGLQRAQGSTRRGCAAPGTDRHRLPERQGR